MADDRVVVFGRISSDTGDADATTAGKMTIARTDIQLDTAFGALGTNRTISTLHGDPGAAGFGPYVTLGYEQIWQDVAVGDHPFNLQVDVHTGDFPKNFIDFVMQVHELGWDCA